RYCNVADVVDIYEQEVAVYKAYPASLKPAIGRGLNKPAIVSIFRLSPTEDFYALWHAKGADSQTIYRLFGEWLRQESEQTPEMREAEFISYDGVADGGTWTFKVPHFSRWGARVLMGNQKVSGTGAPDQSSFTQDRPSYFDRAAAGPTRVTGSP